MSAAGLLALTGKPPEISAREARVVAKEIYGLDADAQPLEGERDCNFRLRTADGGQLVLKFIDPEADDIVVAGQSAALAHLVEQAPHLPVPRLVRTRRGEELAVAQTGAGTCRVRLVTYLAGSPIAGIRPSAALLYRSGARIAELDRALAGFHHPALAQPIAWDIRRAAALLPILPEVASSTARERVASALAPLPGLLPRLRGLRSQAIHGDCHPRNLLTVETADRCAGIIDLGDMIHAPLALEVAVCMAEFIADGITSIDDAGELLSGYVATQALESADVEALFDLVQARLAISVLIQAWRSRSQPPAGGTDPLTELAVSALDQLASRGRDSLTARWHQVAGTPPASRADGGPTMTGNLLERRHRALGANAELSYDQPVQVIRGDGVWVHTANGERLLDVYNNVPHVGHAHPAVAAAIADQARRIASNTRYLDTRIITYVERLTATLPPTLDACLFVNSGSEANDIAWRIAKSHTGRAGALVMIHAYHGITDAVTALSPAIPVPTPPHVEQLAAPLHQPNLGGTGAMGSHPEAAGLSRAHIESAAREDVERALARLRSRGFGLAALMIDSALTSTGIYDPPPEWAAPIAAAVQQAGGLIIGDEVQYGLGRSGSHWWGFDRRGYQPDIVTLGKPVGNGYPLGVVITRRTIIERFQRETGFFSTFGGNPVAAAAGLAVLEVLEREKLLDNARTTGGYFIERLRELAARHEQIADVRGSGLMIGLELRERAGRLVNRLRQLGVLTGSEGPGANVLKLRPPMPFRPQHVDIAIDALAATLSGR